jgi:hypothetical protein
LTTTVVGTETACASPQFPISAIGYVDNLVFECSGGMVAIGVSVSGGVVEPVVDLWKLTPD